MALSIRDLHVSYRTRAGLLHAVRGIDLDVAPGERVGLVGESGSGKTTVVAALVGMLPNDAVVHGSLSVGDLVDIDAGIGALEAHGTLDQNAWRRVRGRRIAAIPQGAMSGLHPTHRVDVAVAEVVAVHTETKGAAALEKARKLLADVGLDERATRAYPHELSGGMRQRVALAAALASEPEVLIADEPTVGLDVVVAHRFVDLLVERQRRDGFGLLVVSHDLPTVRSATDRLLVAYAGRIVESAPTDLLATDPLHPYASGLLAAAPSLDGGGWSVIPGTAPDLAVVPNGCAFGPRCPHASDRCNDVAPAPVTIDVRRIECHLYDPIDDASGQAGHDASQKDRSATVMRVPTSFPTVVRRSAPPLGEPVVIGRSITKVFTSRRWFTDTQTEALVDVDVDVRRGEIVGLVGVSGSGKSTLARTMFGLVHPTSGSIRVDGDELVGMSKARLRTLRRRLAMVHQDPYASLHPAMSVCDLVAEPLTIAGESSSSRRASAADALELVGLDPSAELLSRRAGQLSGGQRQRVAIARGLVADPLLMVLDEPMSMLDASVRAGIAQVLLDVRDRLGLGAVMITHDLAEAASICDRIVVLDAGRVVEHGESRQIATSPTHPATQRLFALAGATDATVHSPVRGETSHDEHAVTPRGAPSV